MRRLLTLVVLATLTLGGAAYAGMDGNCSPEGTWYGYNTEGALWIVNVSRSGPQSFTTVMDNAANPLFPGVAASTDWRGEFVKTGPDQYDWTTMAYWVGEEGGAIPYVLGYCPLTAQFTSCDSWTGTGICSFYAFSNIWDDPFEDGLFVAPGSELQAFFQRMPMKYPE